MKATAHHRVSARKSVVQRQSLLSNKSAHDYNGITQGSYSDLNRPIDLKACSIATDRNHTNNDLSSYHHDFTRPRRCPRSKSRHLGKLPSSGHPVLQETSPSC